MEYLFIYCLQIFNDLECIKIFAWILGTLCLILGTIAFIAFEGERTYYSDRENDFANKIEDFAKKMIIALYSIAVVLTFIPTKQTLLIMGGTWLGKKAVTTVVNDEKIQKIDTIINLELDKMIKDLKGNVQNANNNGQ